MIDTASYYDILNVSPRASDEDVKRAYRLLAMKFHPDRNPQNRLAAENRLRTINEAYAAIKTREKRLSYNKMLKNAPKAGNDNAGMFGWFENMLKGSRVAADNEA